MSLSAFHPTIQRWFAETLGEPSPPQRLGWPAIQSGAHTLIAAPTGSGKTLTAFLSALDHLLRQPAPLPDATSVLYISPLKALGNDVQKNLQAPLAELRARDASLPEVRVLVRTGDTPAHERAAMGRRPPHILVTTPETLYLLLTSDGGRDILRNVRTVIIDEIHAMLGDKRGAHLALSLERLDALTTAAPDGKPAQRIGLSATQKPLDAVGHFLVGAGRDCTLIDAGSRRPMELSIEIPPSPLEAVCSHETWGEIYKRMAALIEAHRTTLVFVNTRKMAERISAQLTKLLGETAVTCHHGSLSRKHRLDAEQRLKRGELRALVATASLELGIDVGDVDLVVQVGTTRRIATLLQRVGRSGHGIGRTPRGAMFPVTRDELMEAGAALRAVAAGELDVTPQPRRPLDILAQQIVAACVPEAWNETELFERFRSAWPYRELTREDFDACVALHTQGRYALLHRDGVGGFIRGTRRARMTAITSGGAIPENADYRVIMQPDETFIGTLNEDFAVESNAGDIVQLGNTSWRILKVEPGIVRVTDAEGQPPSLPFWLGEAPSRSVELSQAMSDLREAAEAADEMNPMPRALGPPNFPTEVARPMIEYVHEGRRQLGAVPTRKRFILERFFDESGGMQLVLHAPLGTHINRAWGLSLRKRFCRNFGFELQAAANDEAVLLSLATQHSFPLIEVFSYLKSKSVEKVLSQALLASPLFETRWRWNVQRSLLVPRFSQGRKLAAPLARMRAHDLLAGAFPDVVACGENLPPGDFNIPMDHPIVRQTVEDCLHEAMDIDGLIGILKEIEAGQIELFAVDTPSPSVFSLSILNANPYHFLDDAPIEERRTQAVIQRRSRGTQSADLLGALDPAAVERVREEAWPQPRDVEEVHEALLWMGFVTDAEAIPWLPWLEQLALVGRVQRENKRWYAAEATRDLKLALRGRMEALGPIFTDSPAGEARDLNEAHLLRELETEGIVLRVRLEGREAWCDRRLLARIHRYTLDRLRSEIQPCTAAQYLRFLARWQCAELEARVEGPGGVAAVLAQLEGFEAPAPAWEKSILPARVADFKPEWLDQITLSGEFVWGRLWGSGSGTVRTAPISFVRRANLAHWHALAQPPELRGLHPHARQVLELLQRQGAIFHDDLLRHVFVDAENHPFRILPEPLEKALAQLITRGFVSGDAYGALRHLLRLSNKRRGRPHIPGRWSPYRRPEISSAGEMPAVPKQTPSLTTSLPLAFPALADPEAAAEFLAPILLRRYGVVFRRVLDREYLPVPWRDLVRVYRRLELAGPVRGGRFVSGFSGEQFALPEAVERLRQVRREHRAADPRTAQFSDNSVEIAEDNALKPALRVDAADPLNFSGILLPIPRVSVQTHAMVAVG